MIFVFPAARQEFVALLQDEASGGPWGGLEQSAPEAASPCGGQLGSHDHYSGDRRDWRLADCDYIFNVVQEAVRPDDCGTDGQRRSAGQLGPDLAIALEAEYGVTCDKMQSPPSMVTQPALVVVGALISPHLA